MARNLLGRLLRPHMIRPFKTLVCESKLSLDDFTPDPPYADPTDDPSTSVQDDPELIEGVSATPLHKNADSRGWLCELLTTRDNPIEPIVHIYQVAAAPRSVRAWVYHTTQADRLAFTLGAFEVALYDIRPGSRSLYRLNIFRVGQDQPCLLRIPPFVVHGVRNLGSELSFFLNMPTSVFHRDAPDKRRLPFDTGDSPYAFDAP